MFFVKWLAPIILTVCGGFMIRMGIIWFRSGNPLKGSMDLLAGAGFVAMALALPSMV